MPRKEGVERGGIAGGTRAETRVATGVKKPGTARQFTKTDWLTLRYLVSVEETPVKLAARQLGIDASTIRNRIENENWRDPKQIAELPALEELIVMRNQKEILAALNVMSGKLDQAMQCKNMEDLNLAIKKSEMLGKHARAAQSVARAVDVSASTQRKIKATKPPQGDPAADRAAIKAELDKLAQTAPSKDE